MDGPNPTEILWLELHSHYCRLVGFARSRGARADAEDIASSVLLRVVSHGNGEAVSWAYLARAAANEIVDRARRECREQHLSEGTFLRPAESVEDLAIASVEAERWTAIALRHQSERTRAMIRLRIDGATWREIAAEFKEPIPTVQARVRRVFLRVRRLIEAEPKHA